MADRWPDDVRLSTLELASSARFAASVAPTSANFHWNARRIAAWLSMKVTRRLVGGRALQRTLLLNASLHHEEKLKITVGRCLFVIWGLSLGDCIMSARQEAPMSGLIN